MLTEEKLQKFLDDLRLGKYDNERYEIKSYEVIDKQSKISIQFIPEKISVKDGIFGKTKFIFKICCRIVAENFGQYRVIIVSDTLWRSYTRYFDEIIEKDDLVLRSKLESSFGL